MVCMAQVWKHSRATKGARLVLLAIADIADDEGVAWPRYDTSISRLKDKCLMSERVVRYNIRHLEGVDQVVNGVAWKGLRPAELAVKQVAGQASIYQVLVGGQAGLFAAERVAAAGPKFSPPDDDEPVDNPVEKAIQRAGDPGNSLPGEGGKGRHKPPAGFAPIPSVHQGTSKESGVAGAVDNRLPHVKAWTDRGLTDRHRRFAGKHGWEPYLELHWTHFTNYVAEPRVGKKYSDLDRAFQNAMTADWGEVRKNARIEREHGNARMPAPQGGGGADRWPPCRYCGQTSSSIHDGIPHCSDGACAERALNREPATRAA